MFRYPSNVVFVETQKKGDFHIVLKTPSILFEDTFEFVRRHFRISALNLGLLCTTNHIFIFGYFDAMYDESDFIVGLSEFHER